MAESGEPAVHVPDQARDGEEATPPRPVVNAANALTVLRIVLVPAFVVIMVASEMTRPGYRIAAALAFGLASLTDFADGWIARSFNQITSFGKVADPIADKALTGTALVLLSAYGALSWWVTVVILVRELGVTALRFWVIRTVVVPASRGGKVKTVLQIVAIAWYIWPFGETLAKVGPVLMWAAVLVTVVTGADYVVRVLRVRRSHAG
jgi:CDP-diacylglycerol--glycerol-3-phosphate 3-phosphatidyltransferase